MCARNRIPKKPGRLQKDRKKKGARLVRTSGGSRALPSMAETILIIAPEDEAREELVRAIQAEGYDAVAISAAAELKDAPSPTVVIVDSALFGEETGDLVRDL